MKERCWGEGSWGTRFSVRGGRKGKKDRMREMDEGERERGWKRPTALRHYSSLRNPQVLLTFFSFSFPSCPWSGKWWCLNYSTISLLKKCKDSTFFKPFIVVLKSVTNQTQNPQSPGLISGWSAFPSFFLPWFCHSFLHSTHLYIYNFPESGANWTFRVLYFTFNLKVFIIEQRQKSRKFSSLRCELTFRTNFCSEYC